MTTTDPPRSHATAGVVSVAFAHEEHLGHRTYAENLRAAAGEHADIDISWVPVQYGSIPSPVDRLPLPAPVRSALAGRREVRHGLRRAEVDVHMFNTQVPAALGGRLARSRPYIVITDVTPVQYDRMADGYGHRADHPGPTRWWKHRVNRRVFAGARWCVGWSRWAAASFVDDYGVDPARVAVIPPGVDTERWCPPAARSEHEGTRILFVGGELTRKGGDLLIASMAELPDDVELRLVTRTPVAPTDRVHVFDDLVPNDPRLIELYRTSDVFAIPSRAETFGIAAAEALLSGGGPVVTTTTGGVPEAVGHAAVTVPVAAPASIAAALDLVTTMGHAERAAWRDRGRTYASRFDRAAVLDRLLATAGIATADGGSGHPAAASA